MLGKLPVPGRPTNFNYSRARVFCAYRGASGGCLDIFTLVYHFSFLSPSLWETVPYRLKYCLKGPLSPKQPTSEIHITINGLIQMITMDKSTDQKGLMSQRSGNVSKILKRSSYLPIYCTIPTIVAAVPVITNISIHVGRRPNLYNNKTFMIEQIQVYILWKQGLRVA